MSITIEHQTREASDLLADRDEKSQNSHDRDLYAIHTVNHRFQEALDYKLYLLAGKQSHYDDEVTWNIAKWTKRR